MVNVCYRRGLVKIMDIYGASNESGEKNVDVIISSNVILPNQKVEHDMFKKGILQSFGRTLLIDLDRPEEEIFREIHKNARYKINRATKRDPIIYHEHTSPTDQEIQQFVQFFDDFAPHKNIPKANMQRLIGLRNNNSLIISYMTDEELNPLCYHAYVAAEEICSLLHSASARFNNPQIRNMIGRANRRLHWEDIKSFKKMGFNWFDFGGLFVEENEKDMEHLNRFKMEFGGQVVDEIREFESYTLLGKLAVLYFGLKMRKRPDFLRAKTLKQNSAVLKSI